MSDLNDPQKVNDLIEVLLRSFKKPLMIKTLSDGELILGLDHQQHSFMVGFDPQTNLWYLEG